MKHHDVCRPIGKCKGCCLNFKTYCLAGLEPINQWDRGRCRSYGDAGLMDRILHQPAPTGAKLTRLRRRTRAKALAGVPHYNGVLDPGKMAGRARRGH